MTLAQAKAKFTGYTYGPNSYTNYGKGTISKFRAGSGPHEQDYVAVLTVKQYPNPYTADGDAGLTRRVVHANGTVHPLDW